MNTSTQEKIRHYKATVGNTVLYVAEKITIRRYRTEQLIEERGEKILRKYWDQKEE